MIIRNTISFIFIFFCAYAFNAGTSNAGPSSNNLRIYEYEVPERLEVFFRPSAMKKYINLLHKATLENSPIITDQYKVRLNMMGRYKERGIEKRFSGNARITGDLKDHLLTLKNYSSISISLKHGNVGGMVKFRLLDPPTKGSKKDILWSLLMEEAGFPSLYRRMVLVNFMGKYRKFLLEERSEKEFLESNGFREGPIIEYDERQIWHNRYVWEIPKKKTFSSIEEGARFYPKNTPLFRYKGEFWIHQMRLKNSEFLKNPTSEEIVYRALYPSFEKNEVLRTFDDINKLYAPHGLGFHNRKYLYDVIYNDYLPIYFDGNPHIPEDICHKASAINISNLTKSRVEIVKAKFMNRTLGSSKVPKKYVCFASVVLQYLSKRITKLKNIKPLKNIEWNIKKQRSDIWSAKNIYDRPPVYNFDLRKRILERCEFSGDKEGWSSCSRVKNKKIKKVFSGKGQPLRRDRFKFFPILNISYLPQGKERFETYSPTNENLSLEVSENTTLYVKTMAKDSVIDVKLEGINSAIVFYNSIFNNSKVKVNSKSLARHKGSTRYNNKLITACATFIDSKISNALIAADRCSKEDGINFIRVEGIEVNLDIKNVLSDGFDADFSKVQFGTVSVSEAANDCVDLSSGVYNFRELNLVNCGDKGLSVGERSYVSAQNIEINNAKTGVASKDLSKVYLSRIDAKNTKTCMTAYQKKQEFGPGFIYLPSKLENCRFKSRNKTGFIKFGRTCSQVETNYFFDTCLQKRNLFLTVKNKIPPTFTFSLRGADPNKALFYSHKINTAYKKKCSRLGKCTFSVELGNRPKTMVFGLMNPKLSTYQYTYELSLQ